MTVRVTRSWLRSMPSGGQKTAWGSCGTSLRPGGRKSPQRLPGTVSIAAIFSKKNVPTRSWRNCSNSLVRREAESNQETRATFSGLESVRQQSEKCMWGCDQHFCKRSASNVLKPCWKPKSERRSSGQPVPKYRLYHRPIVSSPFRWLNRACASCRSTAEISDIVDTVLYLARVRQVTARCFTSTALLMAGADNARKEKR